MIPDLAEVPGRVPSITTQTSSAANRPLQQVTPPHNEGTATACRVESIQQRHSAEAFQVGLLNSFWQGGARPPIQLTSHHGSGGITGVLEEGLIPFRVMSESFWIS